MIQSQNVSKEVICFELRQQSRRATNPDAVLVTEEGEEVTAHQAVLGLHSPLLRNLLQQNTKSYEVPKLILCGVSKTMLEAFIELLYCGEVSLDRLGTDGLTDMLKRLDIDTKQFSLPGVPLKSQSKSLGEKETCVEDLKLETDSVTEEEDFRDDHFDDDSGFNIKKDDEEDCDGDVEENFEDITIAEKIHLQSPHKMSSISIAKTGTDLRKVRYDPELLKKKKEEEIQQGIRLLNGKKKKKPYHLKKGIKRERTGQFVCPECGIVVVRKSSLKKHLQEIHQGIRYPCDQCPHQAKTKISLKHHIESAHEGKRYYCDQCEYAAVSNGSLKKHIRETHCERNYICDDCDFRAKTAKILKVHVDAIHLKLKFTCPECGSKHSQQGHLIKHRKLKHGYKTRDYAIHKQFSNLN